MKTLSSSLSLESQTGVDLAGPTTTLWSVIRTDIVQSEEEDLQGDKTSAQFQRVKELQADGKNAIEIARLTGLPGRQVMKNMGLDKESRDQNALAPFVQRVVLHADLSLEAANDKLLEEQAKERVK